MDNIPRDVQQIIYKFVWNKGIKLCHEEIKKRKISIVAKVIQYNKDANGMCAKKWAFGLGDIIGKCHIIDYSEYLVDTLIFDMTCGLDYKIKEEADLASWVDNIFNIFEDIVDSNKWIELPEPPKLD